MRKYQLFMALAVTVFAVSCSRDNEEPTPPTPPEPTVYGTDLSASGTANCYIVHQAGDYSFDATVMGNGVSSDRYTAGRLAPASAVLLWQDAASVVSGVRLEDERVCFNAGGNPGNAVIAVLDGEGTVLWSWHIWSTDYDPSSAAQKLNGLNWMDRNLGALTDDYDDAGLAKGLAYQWGRKDPFPSGEGWMDMGGITVYDSTGAVADGVFANEQVSVADNMQNAIENPTTFYYGLRIGDDYYDWLSHDGSASNDWLWETPSDAGKTMYDPCPPGWRVPRNGSWKGVNEANFIYDEAALGRRHALLGYYPMVGNRGAASGEWSFVGGQANYWTSTASDEYYVYALNFLPAYLNTESNSNRSAGAPVRCVSETQGAVEPDDPVTGEDVVLDRVTEASYKAFEGSDGSANYYVGLSNTDFEVSESGEQMPVSPGMILYLDLYGTVSMNADDATIPEGKYTLEGGMTDGTANPDYTWVREMSEDGEIVYRKPVEGEIDVTHTTSGYLIECSFIMANPEENFSVKYEGDITFVDRTDLSGDTPVITEPVDVVFTSASATWEYTSSTSERYTIHLLEGTVEGGYLVKGHQMTIDLLTEPLSTKEKMVIKPGIYNPSDDYVSQMTFTVGSQFNLFGQQFYYGTYIQQVESLDVTPLVGFAVDGTIEVLNNGDSYEFVVDVTTPEGVSVKGRYPMGEVTFVDNSPILPSGDWLSVLREDKTVIFTPEDDTECTYRVYTSYFENAVEYEIMIYNYTTSETIQLDLLAPEGSTSIAGTYTTPADPDAPVAGEFIPGYKEFSVIRGTWPYLLYDPDNMYYVGAPGMEGTIEITETENGEFEIQLEMKDDAEPANTVTAHWSGPVRQL